jgi:hypothetical protein
MSSTRSTLARSPGYIDGTTKMGPDVPAYAYANNNPIGMVDPSGREPLFPLGLPGGNAQENANALALWDAISVASLAVYGGGSGWKYLPRLGS